MKQREGYQIEWRERGAGWNGERERCRVEWRQWCRVEWRKG